MNKRTLLAIVLGATLGSAATLATQRLSVSRDATDGTVSAGVDAAASTESQAALIEHGRYIVSITGCHDCHTPGYALMGGKVEKDVYLVGDSLGWQGPWGTTYAINLRLFFQNLTEEQWMQVARTGRARPPMPWMTLHAMNDRDLRAMYRYVRSLPPAGEPAPAYVPPTEQAKTPVVRFPAPPQ